VDWEGRDEKRIIGGKQEDRETEKIGECVNWGKRQEDREEGDRRRTEGKMQLAAFPDQ
jgi:hypothetical protein